MSKLPSMTITQFAELCGVSAQAVSNWKAEGMPCLGGGRKGAAARIDIEFAIPWVVARRDARPDSQRERLAREQADRVALENAERRGETIDAQLVGNVLKELASTVSGQLEALPSRCAGELAAISDPTQIHSRLRAQCRAIRTAMAQVVGKLAEDCERAAAVAASNAR